jgi:hypothetical protein
MTQNTVFVNETLEDIPEFTETLETLEERLHSTPIEEQRRNFKFAKDFSFDNPIYETETLFLFGKQNFSREKILEKKRDYQAILTSHFKEKYNLSENIAKSLSIVASNTPLHKLLDKETGPALHKEFRKEKRRVRSIYQEACKDLFTSKEYDWPNPPRKYLNITKIISKTVPLPRHKNHGKFSGLGAGFTLGNLPLRYVDAYAKVSNIKREDITKYGIVADCVYLTATSTLASVSYYAHVNSPQYLMEAYAYVGAKGLFDSLIAGNIASRVGQLIVRPYRYFHKGLHKHTPALTAVINPFLPEAFIAFRLFEYDLKEKYHDWKEKRKNDNLRISYNNTNSPKNTDLTA